MLLLMGSVPFGGGVLLLRRAVRGDTRDQTIADDARGQPPSSASASAPPVTGVVEPAPQTTISMAAAAATAAPAIESRGATIAGAPATRDTGDVRPQRKRRTWLAMLGLAIALGAFLLDAAVVAFKFSDDPGARGLTVPMLVFFLLLGAIPLLGGLRLAHAGDPEMGRLFISDLGARVRHPLGLVRSSAGLALVIALVSVPAMTIWPDAAPFIGPYALTVFSFVDPLTNIGRRSWWGGAFVSAAGWFVLYLVTGAATDIVSNQPDVQIGFILPLLVYPATMALSGLIRFLLWLAGPRARDSRDVSLTVR